MRKPCRDKRAAANRARTGCKELQDKLLVQDVGTHEEKGCGCSPPHAQPPAVLDCGKSWTQRWINDPRQRETSFGQDEEDLILKLHALLGNRWSLIAGRLPGRTDNEVENYWNFHLKRKLLSMGIDPNSHRMHHTLPRRKNQIPKISNSDDSSSCATFAVSKSQKYYGQNKIHVSNGSGNIDLFKNFDKKSSDLPNLSLELTKITSNSHAAASTSVIGAQEKKSSETSTL